MLEVSQAIATVAPPVAAGELDAVGASIRVLHVGVRSPAATRTPSTRS